MQNEERKNRWIIRISRKLVGRKIVEVRYMNEKEIKSYAWYESAVVLRLDDGKLLYPMQDDEGNGPGTIATTYEELPVLPVI